MVTASMTSHQTDQRALVGKPDLELSYQTTLSNWLATVKYTMIAVSLLYPCEVPYKQQSGTPGSRLAGLKTMHWIDHRT